MRLLIDLSTFFSPFILNEVFEKFNHDNRTKYSFYTVFFGLQTLGLVSVDRLPSDMIESKTNITYKLTATGIEVVALYKKIYKNFFLQTRSSY